MLRVRVQCVVEIELSILYIVFLLFVQVYFRLFPVFKHEKADEEPGNDVKFSVQPTFDED